MNNTDLIWRNLSDFWGRIPQADREVIEKLWEGWMQCLDAEYGQLYNIDSAKSLENCPVFSKYRWCLLDLSKKNLARIKDYIKSVRRESSITQTGGSALNDELKVANHVDHRHFFIRPRNFKPVIRLPFNLEPALIEGYKIYTGVNRSGIDLYYGPDYLIDGSNGIKLGSTITSDDDVGFYVGINETNLDIGHRWVRYSETALSPKDSFILPETYDTDIGVMVFVDGQYIHQEELTYDTSNTVTLAFKVTGLVEFIWYLKEETAEFNQFHEHKFQTFIFNPDAISGTGTAGSVSYIALNPPQGVSPEVRYSGPEAGMKLFLRGYFYPPELYSYNPATGIITFNNPINWSASEFTPIIVEFSEIQNEQFETGHIHVIRQISNYQVTVRIATFDDGGRFDDNGNFDSEDDENQLDLDFEVEDPYNLRVFFNNRLLTYQYDYILSENKKTLFFKFPIDKGNFRFEYERPAGRFTYGATDLDGLTTDQIRKANLLLFYNEDKELQAEFDVDSPYVDTKASSAYQLASQDIYCVSIPVLQNRVDGPELRYLEKTPTQKGYYKIINGGIQSDGKLPEFMWCPVVYFDEAFLAKNFGILVNYVKKESSEPYKQALKAMWSGLWNGPVIQNVEWIISMFLNVPYIPEDGVVQSITKSLVYTEILTDVDRYYLPSNKTTTLNVGDNIYLGQSLERGAVFSSVTDLLSVGEFGSTRLLIPNINLYTSPGDLISIINGSALGIYKVIRTEEDTLIINKPLSGAVGLIQEETFNETVYYDEVENSITWPQFNVAIEVGSFIYFDASYTSVEVVNKIGGRLVLKSLPPVTITSGVAFKAFNKTEFAVLKPGSFPVAKRNGTIRAVNKFNISRILLTNGSFVDVPDNFDLDIEVGQDVLRYQPVSRQVAIYDDSINPEWLYEVNTAFNKEIASGGDDKIERILDSTCDINGFWITDNSVDLIGLVKAGDIFRVASGRNSPLYTYEIELVKNNSFKLKNELDPDTSVVYSIDRLIKVPDPTQEPRRVCAATVVEVELQDTITVSTPNIRIVDVSQLPPSGILRATIDSNTEFIAYGYILENELRDCIRLYNRDSGNVAMSMPAGTKLKLIGEFTEKAIREVFYAGVRSISNIIDNAYITTNHQALYDIIKPNTTVIELFAESGINQPDLVRIDEFLRKILPSSSFWFVDINKFLNDPDERAPEEVASLAQRHLDCLKKTEVATYTNTGVLATSNIALSSTIGIRAGDYVYIPAFTNKYAIVTEVQSGLLILDRLLDPTASTSVEVYGYLNYGTCTEEQITPDFTLHPEVQKGCTVTVIDGLNVGVYPIDKIVGNNIIIKGKFKETGNAVKYLFYTTSNEISI